MIERMIASLPAGKRTFEDAARSHYETIAHPFPASEWHEDLGPVLWWTFPIEEPPYVGTPLDGVWSWPGDGVYTHFTIIPIPNAPE